MTVRFRTSEEIRYPGFEMIAICYRPEEVNLPGNLSLAPCECTHPNPYMHLCQHTRVYSCGGG